MFLNDDIPESGLMTKRLHFFRLETPQNRKRAVFTQQSIVQEQAPDCRIEKIRERVPVQVDYENSARRNAAHFAKNTDRAHVVKMMQRQGRDGVIDGIIGKRKRESVGLHRRDFGKLARLIENRRGGSLIQLQTDQ